MSQPNPECVVVPELHEKLNLNPNNRDMVLEDLLVAVNPLRVPYGGQPYFGFVPVDDEVEHTDHAFMVMLNASAIAGKLMTCVETIEYEPLVGQIKIVMRDLDCKLANTLRTLSGTPYNTNVAAVFNGLHTSDVVIPFFRVGEHIVVADASRNLELLQAHEPYFEPADGKYTLIIPVISTEDDRVDNVTFFYEDAPVPFDVAAVGETLAANEDLHRVVSAMVYMYSQRTLDEKVRVPKHVKRSKNRSKMARKSRKANRKK